MTSYDLVDEAVIHASPDVVWDALVEELSGARAWWTPHNTFEAGSRSPALVGGRTHVTVHPNGVDAGGPRLTFTSRTRAVEPGRRLTGEYVSGVFRGVNDFVLTPVPGTGHTRLRLEFRARPHGWVRGLARLTDVGVEHSKATRAAFANLDALVGDRPVTRRHIPAGAATTVEQVVLHTDDGAAIAVEVARPAVGGSTVVLAHGWAADRRVWDQLTERLTRLGHTVVRYDERGHGTSSQGRAPITLPRLAADLRTVLDALDVRNAVLVGHSGGGFAAAELLAGDPRAVARLRGLVLLGAAAHDQDTSAGEVRMMGSPVFTRALRVPALGRRLLRSTMGADPAGIDLHREMFAATSPAVRADCFAASRGMDLRRALASIAVPTIVAAGTADTVVEPRLGAALAAALPDARFDEIEGAGHMLPLERPDRIALLVEELAHRR